MAEIGRIADEERRPFGRRQCRLAIIADDHLRTMRETADGEIRAQQESGNRIDLDADQCGVGKGLHRRQQESP